MSANRIASVVSAAMARIGQANLGFFDTHPYDLTLIRELTRIGRFDLVVDNLKRNDAVPGAPYAFPVALALIDLPPAERLRLAGIADQAGLPLVAGGLLASLPSHETWPGFLKRHYRNSGFNGARGYYIALSAYHFDSPPLPDPRNSMNGELYRKLIQTVIAASWIMPQSALLYDYMLHNGREPIYGKRAAMALKK
eukprot:gene35206-47310_t